MVTVQGREAPTFGIKAVFGLGTVHGVQWLRNIKVVTLRFDFIALNERV